MVEWRLDLTRLMESMLEVPSLVAAKSAVVATLQSLEVFMTSSPSSSAKSWQLDVARVVALALFVVVLYCNVLCSKKDCIEGKAKVATQRNNSTIRNCKIQNATDKPVFEQSMVSSKREPSLVVFSGGTAFNSMVKSLATKVSTRVTYVLPISDNGGSSREIARVLGGPAIGDVRSRLVRLADDSSPENRSIKFLLEHRLNQFDKVTAKEELVNIINGVHGIWSTSGTTPLTQDASKQSISEPYKKTFVAFLTYFYQAAAAPHFTSDGSAIEDDEFDFRGGSIGNFIFTGARLFFQSLEAAILWFSTLSSIPASSRVCPVILYNSRVHIAAMLADGSHVVGQESISHPLSLNCAPTAPVDKEGSGQAALPSPVRRVYYLSEKGLELRPLANPTALRAIAEGETIIYGMGSLYTSLVPCLIAQGVGRAVRDATCPKLLVLNGSEDRETGGMKLLDYVSAVVAALKQSEGIVAPSSFGSNGGRYLTKLGGRDVRRYVTNVAYIDSDHVRSTLVPSEHLALLVGLGIKVHAVSGAEEAEVCELLSSGASLGAAGFSTDRLGSEHYSLGGRGEGDSAAAVNALVVQRYREELPSFVRLTPVNRVSRGAYGVLFGSRPSKPSVRSMESHYAAVDSVISRINRGACSDQAEARLRDTHYGREALAETIRAIAERHLAGLGSKRSGFLFF